MYDRGVRLWQGNVGWRGQTAAVALAIWAASGRPRVACCCTDVGRHGRCLLTWWVATL